jgi:protein O-mannosyl-transferase
MSKKNKKPVSVNQTANHSIIEEPQKSASWHIPAMILGLVAVTFIVFAGALGNDFVEWDDQIYIRENPIIQDAGFGQLGKIFSTSVALNYHPLTIFSLMFNALFFGKGATSYIFTNILIHTLNTVFVFLFIQKLTQNRSLISFFTALLFAIHPLRVESVVWISERKDVLYTCFFLAGCLTYLNYLSQNQRKYLIYTYILFVCSCLSKAQAVVFPLVLILIDYWFDESFDRKKIINKLPFLLISFLFGFIALNIQSGGNFGGLITPAVNEANAIDIKGYDVFDKLQIGTFAFVSYLYKLFLPLDLTPLYPYIKEADGSTPASYKLGLILFPLIIGFAIWSYKRYKIITFGVFFYLICIVLVLQFLSVGVALMADRYSYLPFIGIFFLIAYCLDKLSPKYVIWGVYSVFALWCAYLTTKQVKVWRDSISLYSQRININPNDIRALEVRGEMYLMKQRIEEGVTDLEKAFSMGLRSEQAHLQLGIAYGNSGKKDKAAEQFTKVIEINPSNIEAYLNRANAYFPNAQAIADYEKAISLSKEPNPDALAYLGVCYANQGNVAKGLESLNKAISSSKNPSAGHLLNRAIMLRQTGNRQGAVNDLKQVIQADPNNQQAQQMMRELQ